MVVPCTTVGVMTLASSDSLRRDKVELGPLLGSGSCLATHGEVNHKMGVNPSIHDEFLMADVHSGAGFLDIHVGSKPVPLVYHH